MLSRVTELDLSLEHGHRVEETDGIAHDHARLLAVGCNDHDGAELTGSEMASPVLEARKEDGNDGEHETLTPASSDAKPSLAERCRWWRAAAGVLAVERELVLGHGQGEQGRQERDPRRPAIALEVQAEDLGVLDCGQDVHGGSSESADTCSAA